MNINNPTTFSTPDLTLSTSNSSGSAGALRADDTILVYDATVPTTISSGASASAGNSATAARRNHTHGAFTITASASQAEEEAESSTTVFTSPGVQKYHPGVAKFWVQYNGYTGARITYYNVTGVSDDGTGDQTVTIGTAFSGADWCVGAFPGAQNLGDIMIASTQSASSIRIMGSTDTGAAADMNEVYVWGFGEQVDG